MTIRPTFAFNFEWTGRSAKNIRERSSALVNGLGLYFKRLLFPLYLFAIKLVTYTAYYFVKFLIKFIFAFIGLIIETENNKQKKNELFERKLKLQEEIFQIDHNGSSWLELGKILLCR